MGRIFHWLGQTGLGSSVNALLSAAGTAGAAGKETTVEGVGRSGIQQGLHQRRRVHPQWRSPSSRSRGLFVSARLTSRSPVTPAAVQEDLSAKYGHHHFVHDSCIKRLTKPRPQARSCDPRQPMEGLSPSTSFPLARRQVNRDANGEEDAEANRERRGGEGNQRILVPAVARGLRPCLGPAC